MRIDAHQHYWEIGRNGHSWPVPELRAIYQDFLPEQLEPDLHALDIGRTVLVQAQPNSVETEWLLDLAGRTASVGAVVGWTDFRAPDAATRIATLAMRPKLRGLRPMLQDLAPDWILDPAAAPALRAMVTQGLVFDALIKPQHLKAIIQLAETYPALQIVVDHGAKPAIGEGLREPWAADITALAALPNLSCKVSGLVTEAKSDWDEDDLAFYVRHLIDSFGPDRLLWGSDWPVVLLASDYRRWWATAEALTAHFPSDAREAIFGGNAQRIYRIAPEGPAGPK